MYKVKFDTGETVSFANQPSDADIEEVVKSMGIKPNSSQIPEQAAELPKKGLMQQASDTIGSIFPGKKVGESIGTLGGLAYEKAKGLLGGQDNSKFYDTSAPSPLQVAGDVASGALTVAAPNVGTGATALGRIGANAALGAGIGGSNAIAQGEDAKSVAKDAAFGGAIGGAVSAAGEGIKSLASVLPKWITKAALPKLDNKNIDYAIEKTSIGSLPVMQKTSNQAIGTYENSIQSILSHPEFKGVAEDTGSIVGSALKSFPDAEYTPMDLLDNAKNIAPKVSKLITKFEAGQANMQEINAIRKELDSATKSVYTSLNRPPEAKILGATLSNAIRDYVQTNAPATQSIFQDYAKEIGLNKAINAAVKKGEQKIRLKDLLAAGSGYAHSGLKGALEAVILERVGTSPGLQIGAAKAIQASSKSVQPAINSAFQGLKAPIMNKLSK